MERFVEVVKKRSGHFAYLMINYPAPWQVFMNPQPTKKLRGTATVSKVSAVQHFFHDPMNSIEDIMKYDELLITKAIPEYNRNDFSVIYPIPLTFNYSLLFEDKVLGDIRIETEFKKDIKELYFNSSFDKIESATLSGNSLITNGQLIAGFVKQFLFAFTPQSITIFP
jgi:hypothetical protein